MLNAAANYTVEELLRENEILREEVRVSRQASEITAELVAKQFAKTEEILARLQRKAETEEELGQKLAQQLLETESREKQLAEDRIHLSELQAAAINMMEDIVAARQIAEKTTRAKSEFLTNMSHEMRTPLTAIVGFSNLLLDDDTDPISDEKSRVVRTIRSNSEHVLRIINDILDLSKLEADQMIVERAPCSPTQILSEIEAFTQSQIELKGLEFAIELHGEIPSMITTDAKRLRQILAAAVGMSIRFTESGFIHVTATLSDDTPTPMLTFDIVDTGSGFSDDQVEKLFEPFSEAGSVLTRNFGGTGLDLAIGKRLAQSLGGDIAIVTTQEGVGTRMRVTIEADQTNMPTTAKRHIVPGPACRILVAEDNLENQHLIKHILKPITSDVVVVENGQQAKDVTIETLRSNTPFHIVLIDVHMPVMDGYQAARELRKAGYAGAIIALTARHNDAEERSKCLSAGCNDFAEKPINRNKLVQTIKDHLESSGLS